MQLVLAILYRLFTKFFIQEGLSFRNMDIKFSKHPTQNGYIPITYIQSIIQSISVQRAVSQIKSHITWMDKCSM